MKIWTVFRTEETVRYLSELSKIKFDISHGYVPLLYSNNLCPDIAFQSLIIVPLFEAVAIIVPFLFTDKAKTSLSDTFIVLHLLNNGCGGKTAPVYSSQQFTSTCGSVKPGEESGHDPLILDLV